MIDSTVFLAIVSTLLLIVFVRIALTLKDISESLSRMAGGGLPPAQVKVDVSIPRTIEAPEAEEIPDETEIAAVIAVAKAALEGAL